MSNSPLTHIRRRVGYALVLTLILGVAWFFSPGLPVLWGPRASAAVKEAGKALFVHEWQPNDPLAGGDGLGPVFNASSCVACHFQGGVGGGGPNQRNVTAFEVHPTKRDPQVRVGLVHTGAVDKSCKETDETLRKIFPVVPGGRKVFYNCTTQFVDFDPVRTESVNSTALFGAGWIDRISTKSIKNNQMRKTMEGIAREFKLDFDAIPQGRARILPDGRLGKFGWKGQFATLKEFVAAACANEIGLGNPVMEQAKPLGKNDHPAVPADLDRKQFAALVAFVDTLPRPTEMVPKDSVEQARAANGKKLFHSVGCVLCHTPDIGGVKGVYSDFLLHTIEETGYRSNESENTQLVVPLPTEHPRPEEWKTPPLWGVADSAPYFHDGGSATLQEAILRHAGTAKKVIESYRQLPNEDREAIIGFLQTLKAPPDHLVP